MYHLLLPLSTTKNSLNFDMFSDFLLNEGSDALTLETSFSS